MLYVMKLICQIFKKTLLLKVTTLRHLLRNFNFLLSSDLELALKGAKMPQKWALEVFFNFFNNKK